MDRECWPVCIGASTLWLSVRDALSREGPEPSAGLWWIATLVEDAYQGQDFGALRVVSELLERLTGQGEHGDSGHGSDRAAETLREAVRQGRLHVEQVPTPSVGLAVAGPRLAQADVDAAPAALEVREPDLAFFEVRVVDEVGDPISDLRVHFTAEGIQHNIPTDGRGVARIENIDASSAWVQVTAPHELMDALAPRWALPREPKIAESTDSAPVQIEQLDDHFDPLRLRRNLRTTLVITPRFACREVTATTFDFGKSFIRKEGIAVLATIAQELHQNDSQHAMIYGHTDRSGSERVNKRLSERRAKAVYAVLTHDFGKWEEMWRGTINEHPWHEKWGTRQLQHMLNALRCRDDAGAPLTEDGAKGTRSNQAIRRFRRGDYPSKPAEQAALPNTARADVSLRRELFLAYAKLVSRTPVAANRIASVGGTPFMGCGEFNPLSQAAKDEESRRSVVFIFDPAAAPQNLPCKLGDAGVCESNLVEPSQDAGDQEPTAPSSTEPTFYRCSVYRKFATCCSPVGGPDLARDVIVRFFMELSEANDFSHRFVLEAEDETDEEDDDDPVFRMEQTLRSDARVTEPDPELADGLVEERMVELHFTHVPDAFAYRLRVEGIDQPHTVFGGRRFHMISELSAGAGLTRFPRVHAILNPGS